MTVSMVLYGCTTWTLTKRIQKMLDRNYIRMLRATLNVPLNNSCTATYLQSQKNIQVIRTRHARHCWRKKDELISDVLLWTLKRGRATVCRLGRTYLHQLYMDTGYSLEELLGVTDGRYIWREREREREREKSGE